MGQNQPPSPKSMAPPQLYGSSGDPNALFQQQQPERMAALHTLAPETMAFSGNPDFYLNSDYIKKAHQAFVPGDPNYRG